MAQNFNLNAIERHFKQVLLYAPGLLGNDAVNFFLDSWKRQGWLNYSNTAWRQRSKNSKRNKGRAILVDSGRLRRSIRIVKITGGAVTIGTDVPYARMHNEGFKGVVNIAAFTRNRYVKEKVGIGKLTKKGKEKTKTVSRVGSSHTVKAHTRRVNMPQRQFMGYSHYLDKQLHRRLMGC